MKKIINRLKKIIKDDSAQGMAEYVLLLVAIIGVGLLFKEEIKRIVESKLGTIGSDIDSFNSN